MSPCEKRSCKSFHTSAAESIHKIDLTRDSSTERCIHERIIVLRLFHELCIGSVGGGCGRIPSMKSSLFLESRHNLMARAHDW
ncbi:hypothetical protein Lalb_Chr22g0361091 [Lupinus albus]|uniref:Uncharacterized protein n=1 Tax=Lupinus albus TaxID=3870 RepID=A0A6A4NJD6_LUPAL|nr:hypothetical protein Lalb_Chr22g0361091 [Lupinus albus]